MRDLQCLKYFELMILITEVARMLHIKLIERKAPEEINSLIQLIQEYQHALDMLNAPKGV